MLKPEAHVNIKFYETTNGGRKHPTLFGDYFGFIFRINDKNFDCRLLFDEPCSIFPGESRDNVPVKFLWYDGAKKELQVNKKFYLWDGRNIGEGIIIDFIE